MMEVMSYEDRLSTKKGTSRVISRNFKNAAAQNMTLYFDFSYKTKQMIYLLLFNFKIGHHKCSCGSILQICGNHFAKCACESGPNITVSYMFYFLSRITECVHATPLIRLRVLRQDYEIRRDQIRSLYVALISKD